MLFQLYISRNHTFLNVVSNVLHAKTPFIDSNLLTTARKILYIMTYMLIETGKIWLIPTSTNVNLRKTTILSANTFV